MTSPQQRRVLLRWLIPTSGLLLILTVVMSPFALDVFNGVDTEWQRRSTIGQTYGAISALLATLALAGVALSVFFQRQETRANRAFALRSIHLDLLKMAIDDAELRSCIALESSGETATRQHLYCNLLFSFWETRYLLGELRHEEIKGLAAQMLATPAGHRFWTDEREYRIKYGKLGPASIFRRTFDEEYRSSRYGPQDGPGAGKP